MLIVYFLVPAALLMGIGFLWVFVWNVKNEQYEDLVTPAVRVLVDEVKDHEGERNEKHH